MALFDTSEELKNINSAFAISFELNNIQSFLDDAQRKYILPLIGSETLAHILAAKQAAKKAADLGPEQVHKQATDVANKQTSELDAEPSGLSDYSPQKKLIHLLQKAVLGFAFSEYSSYGALQIQDAGITVLSRENFRPASDAKMLALCKQSRHAGFEAQEALVECLEAHLNEFPSYAASAARQQNRAGFISSSAAFTQVSLAIHASVFFQLKQELLRQEKELIRPLLGETRFQELKKAHQATVLTIDQQKLIEKIQAVIAPLALAETIPYGGLLIDGQGCFQSNEDPLSTRAAHRLQLAMVQLLSRGKAELEQLRKMINKRTRDAMHPVASPHNSLKTTLDSVQQSNLYLL